MIECENFVDVTVNGPKDQVDIYVDWLSTSGECIFGMNFNSQTDTDTLFLTPAAGYDHTWEFVSSNVKRRIRTYKHKKTNTIEFRINYLVFFGNHILPNGDFIDLNINDYPDGIYSELMKQFIPVPEHIKKRCPQLVSNCNWGSYYIKYNYSSFDNDSFISV